MHTPLFIDMPTTRSQTRQSHRTEEEEEPACIICHGKVNRETMMTPPCGCAARFHRYCWNWLVKSFLRRMINKEENEYADDALRLSLGGTTTLTFPCIHCKRDLHVDVTGQYTISAFSLVFSRARTISAMLPLFVRILLLCISWRGFPWGEWGSGWSVVFPLLLELVVTLGSCIICFRQNEPSPLVLGIASGMLAMFGSCFELSLYPAGVERALSVCMMAQLMRVAAQMTLGGLLALLAEIGIPTLKAEFAAMRLTSDDFVVNTINWR